MLGLDTYEWLFLPDEDTVPDAKISDEVGLGLNVKLYLEVAPSVLFWRRLVLVGNHKIVRNPLLHILDMMTYDGGWFIV